MPRYANEEATQSASKNGLETVQKFMLIETDPSLKNEFDAALRHPKDHSDSPFEVSSKADPSVNFWTSYLPLEGARIVAGGTTTKMKVVSVRHNQPSLIFPIEGSVRIIRGNDAFVAEAGRTAVLLPANCPITIECDAIYRGVSIMFEPERFEQSAAQLLNLPSGRSDHQLVSLNRIAQFPLTYDSRDISSMMVQVLSAIETLQNPAYLLKHCNLSTALYQVIIALLLPQHVFGGDQQPKVAKNSPGLYRLQHGVRYIDENLSDTLTLRDVRHYCKISARALQYSFRTVYNMTPNQWIQERKLTAVRAALLSAEKGLTVTSAAMPFFGNLGDFARRYRSRFGELPSATLARQNVAQPNDERVRGPEMADD